MRRQVAAVELHALDKRDFGRDLAAFLDGDDAVLADLLQGVRQNLADFRIVVAGDGGDRLHGFLVAGFDRSRLLLQSFDNRVDCLVHAPLQRHRVVTRGDEFEAFTEDRFGQDCRGRGAVASHVAGLGSHFLHELSAHVFVGVFQFDVFSHGHTVFGDLGSTPALVQHSVAAAGAQSTFHRP